MKDQDRMLKVIERSRHSCQMEFSRTTGVSRARMTQIVDLRNLAPVIQEQLLFLGLASLQRFRAAFDMARLCWTRVKRVGYFRASGS